jgi:ABC-type bacteriocin/lantibiotic exporter with double-glycine peptidase domain
VQWPDFEQGSAMTDLARALEKRGLHCEVVRLSERQRLRSTEPAIVHVRSSAKPDEGHYYVVVGSDGESAQIWDGLRGMRALTPRERRTWSGPILLVSASTDPRHIEGSASYIAIAGCVASIITITISACVARRISVPRLRSRGRLWVRRFYLY